MDFTGERVIPGQVDADLWQEHVSRYEFARALVKRRTGARILDAGCGTGYGAARLADALRAGAGEVVGVDVAAEAVAWASEHYTARNLHFRQGDVSALPDSDASFDLVVAFEVIEHLPDAVQFLSEVRRVLRPRGTLLVSTPNRRYYTEERGQQNPFHTREYDAVQFRTLLEAHFTHCRLLEQNHVPAITFRQAGIDFSSIVAASGRESDEPHFFIAICSQHEDVPVRGFVYLPESGNVLRERELHIHKLEMDLAAFQSRTHLELTERREWAEKLEVELREKGEIIAGIQRELEERREWAAKLDAELHEKGEFIARMQREAEERTAWALDLERRIAEATQVIESQEKDLRERAAWAESLNADIATARARLQELDAEMIRREAARLAQVTELDQELERRAAWAHCLNDEITGLKGQLRLIQDSKWYRAGKRLGLAPAPDGSPE